MISWRRVGISQQGTGARASAGGEATADFLASGESDFPGEASENRLTASPDSRILWELWKLGRGLNALEPVPLNLIPTEPLSSFQKGPGPGTERSALFTWVPFGRQLDTNCRSSPL